VGEVVGEEVEEAEEGDGNSSSQRYPTKGRGGQGVRDIKTTERNGPVVDIVSVKDDNEVIMITRSGKLQRMQVKEIRITGRNTQGVRIMSMDESDALVAVVRVPPEDEIIEE
jgi:DNA gyrase subunit A